MKYFALVLVAISLVCLISACTALDQAATPSPDTGVSAITTGVEQVVHGPIGGMIPQPWGEVLLAGVVLLQNMYLGVRGIQRKIKNRKKIEDEPTPEVA